MVSRRASATELDRGAHCHPTLVAVLAVMAAATLAGCGDDDGPGSDGGLGADAGAPDAGVDAGPPVPECKEGGPRPDGDPCGCDDDCTEGALCETELAGGWPGGRCRRLCGSSDVTCTPGTTCFDEAAMPECSPECADHDDCGPGRRCNVVGRCVGRCLSDAECDSGACDPFGRRCVDPDDPPTGGEVLAFCDEDAECRSRECSASLRRCLTFCYSDDPTCPGDAFCVIDGVEGLCFPSCETQADCNDIDIILRCQNEPGIGGICVPT